VDYPQGPALNRLGVPVAQLTSGGILLTVNDELCRIIDHSREDLLERNFREIFQAEDSWYQCDSGLTRLIAGRIDRYSTDLSAKRGDGQVVWLRVFFSAVREDATEAPRNLIFAATDVTLLKQKLQDAVAARDELSQRMTNAQEADRTRIARELHDDIGQSLAILKIQMLRAGQPVSGHPDQTHASLKDLVRDLETIILKVSRISHDLHSSELEFLGLAVAVQAQCDQCSLQMHIPVHCSCNQVRKTLDGLIALAFLRVLQEALHNVVKHSRATTITVRLTESDSDLTLEVFDDGVGFDVESSKLAAGLGLISMRERMHLIGGEFEILSSLGHGTKVRARAPIVKQ
jgi:PAS domain S-box-containing protein